MRKISQVFIFCAGRGERMMPLTQSTPKPLLKINDQPILGHLIDKIAKITTIEKIIINAYYLAEEIINYTKSLQNPKIIISREKEKIETGGGLFYALNKIDLNSPLLTLNGDVLWRDEKDFADMEYLFNNFDVNKHDFLLGLKKTNDFLGYDGSGDFNLNQNGNLIRDFSSNNPCEYVYVGMQVLNPKYLLMQKQQQNLPQCFSVSHFYKSAVDKNYLLSRIDGRELRGKYFHIGTPQNLELAKNFFNTLSLHDEE